MADEVAAAPWPVLPSDAWSETIATIHLWTQIVGKVRLALAPPMSHWWHAPLYVSARGLTTSPMAYGSRLIEAEFDLLRHVLEWRDSEGSVIEISLPGCSVADLYTEVLDVLRRLDVRISITTRPVEIIDAIPFPEDTFHATYVPEHAQALHRALIDAHRVLTRFRAPFLGKASPVHFWWGSFDLAVTRFSGRTAPRPTSTPPNCAPWVMDEAYSHEVSSAGWWPALNSATGPAFYAYAYPEPPGFASARVRPSAAAYDPLLGEFVISNAALRAEPDPDAAALAFLESTYEATADLGGWDRAAIEPPRYPVGLPSGAWSVTGDDEGPTTVG